MKGVDAKEGMALILALCVLTVPALKPTRHIISVSPVISHDGLSIDLLGTRETYL
jgi:hypothetical protein